MLTAKKENSGSCAIYRLAGVLDEHANLNMLIGKPTTEIRVGCKGITRVNSFGIKHWVKYFSRLSSLQVTYAFFECSPVIVEQMNLIDNFLGTGKVESLYLPFLCEKCTEPYVSLVTTEAWVAGNSRIPCLQCPNCKSQLKFDDNPEQYLGLLQR